MLGVQYTYMASIERGNAAVATLLQYLAPVMIIMYLLIRGRSAPTKKDMLTAALSLIGCFFLLTNGSLTQLSVPHDAVVWGVLSGAAHLMFTSLPIEAYLYLCFVILFGTMLAFWFYIESLNSLSPKESSLMGSLEPVAAVLTTVFWLKDSFGGFQWMGTLCIMIMVIYLALNKEAASNSRELIKYTN